MVNYVHLNFLTVVELIVGKLPSEALNNVWATQLQNLIKNKKVKKIKKNESPSIQLRATNENIINILKNLVR